jgi:hypothetical protein
MTYADLLIHEYRSKGLLLDSNLRLLHLVGSTEPSLIGQRWLRVEERSVPSYVVVRRPEFRYLGLTDTALSALAQEFLIVTDDGRMVNYLRDHIGANALKWVEVLGIQGTLRVTQLRT